MSAPRQEETGLVLSVEDRGERFCTLSFLGSGRGLFHPLVRKSKRSPRPDIFDTARIMLSPSKEGNLYFVNEYEPLKKRTGIGTGYERVRVASRYAEFLCRNTYHLEHVERAFPLSERFFDTVEAGRSPEAAFFKTIYLFVLEEGYPVREDWRVGLAAESRDAVRAILHEPLDRQTIPPETARQHSEDLMAWLRRTADFV